MWMKYGKNHLHIVSFAQPHEERLLLINTSNYSEFRNASDLLIVVSRLRTHKHSHANDAKSVSCIETRHKIVITFNVNKKPSWKIRNYIRNLNFSASIFISLHFQVVCLIRICWVYSKIMNKISDVIIKFNRNFNEFMPNAEKRWNFVLEMCPSAQIARWKSQYSDHTPSECGKEKSFVTNIKCKCVFWGSIQRKWQQR